VKTATDTVAMIKAVELRMERKIGGFAELVIPSGDGMFERERAQNVCLSKGRRVGPAQRRLFIRFRHVRHVVAF